MSSPEGAQAGVFVTSRGNAWATGLRAGVGGLAGNLAGSAAEKRASGTSPLAKGDLAYLAVLPESVVVYKAKRGALKPKALPEILGEMPRSALQASRYKKGTMVGVFELDFADGSSWAFDVGRAFAKSAAEVAARLGSDTA